MKRDGITDSSAARIFRYFPEYGLKPFATAGFFVLVAFLWTLLLQHTFPYPFLFLFFGAVMGSAWFGGTIAGALSVILSTLTIAYFFVPPLYSWSIDTTAESYFVAFIVSAATVSWVSSAKKRSETAIREARDQLEQRVQERTAELQQSYAEIQESERQLKLLTEAIPQQIWSATADGNVQYCNQHLLRFVGRSMEEMQGGKFFSIVHPEDLGLFREAWESAFRSGNRFEGEWRVRRADGLYRWFLVRGVPQQSSDGQIARWYGTHIEIEERHRAEQALIAAQAELAHLSRTLSMGELAAGIMHEINQPLTAVVTHAYACREWLNMAPANLEKASLTAERIVQESTRASSVVARVRALFQKEPPSKERLDINRVIQNLVRLLRDEAIRRDVNLHTELCKDLPRINADRVQIEQVLLNLAMNGMDAMEQTEGSRELVIASSMKDPKEIWIRVEDCGTGINPRVVEKIFDPFFSTKPNGIGMGLAISRSIIEAHDGRLWATPRGSGGSVFQFTLPVQP
jgi:PAS domain S-box-containing protein